MKRKPIDSRKQLSILAAMLQVILESIGEVTCMIYGKKTV